MEYLPVKKTIFAEKEQEKHPIVDLEL